ncbi:MAG TPA: rhodanese-like domain-containing protein [bacterium]|jgi:rhodanese-related sulfurtransferase|nr:rhodanese-like domain-containing protein [bacterium]
MRFSQALLAALLVALPLSAVPAMADAPAASPSANLTPLSYPPVTPDPSFTDSVYAMKWPHITLAETQRLLKKKGTILVDGRSMLEWQQSHLKGALPLPLGDFEKQYAIYAKRLKKAKIIIAYCHGKGCHLSDSLCQDLVNKGFKNVAVFWGGYPEWSAAKLPLVDKYGRLVATTAPAAAPAGH